MSFFSFGNEDSYEANNLTLRVGEHGETTAELIEELSQDPDIDYVIPNYLFELYDLPNEADF